MPPSNSPLVSVLVLNYNGREHLERCLPSIDAQVYPSDRFRIEVIDNGSTDGSLDFVRARFPQAVVHRFDRNEGFAAPYDAIARKCQSEWLVFLNNDTRVAPSWLAELVSAAERNHADCVASRILDWDGKRIDFVGGLVSFIGHSWQRDIGEPADREYEERPLLFACGGSMLIKRDVYIDAGAVLAKAMAELSVEFDGVTEAAAAKAGRLRRSFRQSGGVRGDRIVPDFLVGAHALERADALLTRDRGFYRRYFKGLQVIEP